jgi:exodeoxyribonuclease VII large subunit
VLTGPDATAQLTGAVSAGEGGTDVVLLVRDVGRPLQLASYDALEVARAVADAPVPVVAALGGQGTRTAVDEVAWASMPTAEVAVDWLLGRLGDVERRLSALGAEVTQAVDEAEDRCRALLVAGRDQTSQAVEEAVERSTAARRRRRLQLRVVCAVLAVGVSRRGGPGPAAAAPRAARPGAGAGRGRAVVAVPRSR